MSVKNVLWIERDSNSMRLVFKEKITKGAIVNGEQKTYNSYKIIKPDSILCKDWKFTHYDNSLIECKHRGTCEFNLYYDEDIKGLSLDVWGEYSLDGPVLYCMFCGEKIDVYCRIIPEKNKKKKK